MTADSSLRVNGFSGVRVPECRVVMGDAMVELGKMEAESVHCCVTSPPYWGLRDYGVAGQLGLESTPDQYVAKMVEVFREVRRVLRKDGTCWINLGDSYNGSGKGGNPPDSPYQLQKCNAGSLTGKSDRNGWSGLKPKDLVGIPWRVAFALQEDGWWLRQDIIWHKPNPMPESVTDRCNKAHEYIFLLSKSERYFYDQEAIREAAVEPDRTRNDRIGGANGHTVRHSPGGIMTGTIERNRRSVWTVTTQPYADAHFATYPPDLIKPCILAGCPVGGTVLDPFGGSGTTGEVALELGRNAVLIELNPAYIPLIQSRIHTTPGLPI